MRPLFLALPDTVTADYRAGAPDAYGLPPERAIASSDLPCRATLRPMPKGTPYLIVAHRPFEMLNPYTETGPIFISANPHPSATPSHDLPSFLTSPSYLLRGYSKDERIVYGTGAVIPTEQIITRCTELLSRSEVAFVHIRSAQNNCFHCRVERG